MGIPRNRFLKLKSLRHFKHAVHACSSYCEIDLAEEFGKDGIGPFNDSDPKDEENRYSHYGDFNVLSRQVFTRLVTRSICIEAITRTTVMDCDQQGLRWQVEIRRESSCCQKLLSCMARWPPLLDGKKDTAAKELPGISSIRDVEYDIEFASGAKPIAERKSSIAIYTQEIVRLHGTPSAIVSDKDPRFTFRILETHARQEGYTNKLSRPLKFTAKLSCFLESIAYEWRQTSHEYHSFHVISYPHDQIREDLSHLNEPESILNCQDIVMRNKTISFCQDFLEEPFFFSVVDHCEAGVASIRLTTSFNTCWDLRKDQIALDEQIARDIQAKLNAEILEERKLARKQEEEANIALIESWENTQAMIEADRLLAERL
ncbi:hypothetical protein Tco_0268320 [Tanacetum coccineum]